MKTQTATDNPAFEPLEIGDLVYIPAFYNQQWLGEVQAEVVGVSATKTGRSKRQFYRVNVELMQSLDADSSGQVINKTFDYHPPLLDGEYYNLNEL